MSSIQIYKTVPRKHQEMVLEDSKERKYCGLLMEMGTGKSKIIIDTLAYLWREQKIKAAVIIAPKGAYRNWEEEEIPKHMPDDIPYHLGVWGSLINKAARIKLDQMWFVKDKLKILLANVESLSTTKGAQYIETFLKYEKPNILVIDESMCIKETGSKRSKTAVLLSKHAEYRRILTGTPAPKNPLDLYNQLRFLDPKALGYSSYFAFRNRFAIMETKRLGTRSFQVVSGFRNMEELQKITRKMGYVIKKKDCLDLPEKTYMSRRVEMTVEQYSAYTNIWKSAVLLVEDAKRQGIVTAPLAITAIAKMRQITSGHVKDDSGNEYLIPNKRIDSLLELLDEVEGPVVIWAHYIFDVKLITQKLSEEYGGDQVVSYFGETSSDDRVQAIKRFQNGDARFFVGNPQVGGLGITLTAASQAVYYNNDYNLAYRLQSEDRIHRIGQTNQCTYIDMYCPGTIEERILQCLRDKKDLMDLIMADPIAVLSNDEDKNKLGKAYI